MDELQVDTNIDFDEIFFSSEEDYENLFKKYHDEYMRLTNMIEKLDYSKNLIHGIMRRLKTKYAKETFNISK